MRIQVTRTGGFAGLRRGGVVETEKLPDAEEWQKLAEQALADARLTGEEDRAGVPDGFHYELSVDDRVVHSADPHLSDAQRDLFRRVLAEGA